MTVEIRDSAGELVTTLASPASAGLHQVEWDLVREGTGGGGFRSRNFVAAGAYSAVVTVDGASSSVPVRVEQR